MRAKVSTKLQQDRDVGVLYSDHSTLKAGRLRGEVPLGCERSKTRIGGDPAPVAGPSKSYRPSSDPLFSPSPTNQAAGHRTRVSPETKNTHNRPAPRSNEPLPVSQPRVRILAEIEIVRERCPPKPKGIAAPCPRSPSWANPSHDLERSPRPRNSRRPRAA